MRGFSFVTMEAYDDTIRGKILEAVKIYWLDIYSMRLPMEARRKLQALRDQAAKIQAPAEKEYNQYMQSGAWLRMATNRKAAYRKLTDGFSGLGPCGCGVCAVAETEEQPHHVHHLNYAHFALERPADLLPLCVMCHCFIHPLGTMADEVFRDNADNQSIANSLDYLRVYRQIVGIDDLVAVYLYIAASSKSKAIDRVADQVKPFLMELAEEYSIDVLKSQLVFTWFTRGQIKQSLRQYLTYACRSNFRHEYGIELPLEVLINEAREEI